MVKILQVGKYFPPRFGGIETVTSDLMGLNSYDQLSCDVICFDESTYSSVESGGVIYRCKSWFKVLSADFSLTYLFQVFFKAWKYDVLHVHYPNPLAALIVGFLPYRGKVVVQWHSDVVKQKFAYKLYRPIQRRLLHRADIIVGTSQAYVEYSKQLSDFMHKVTVIPLGVERRENPEDFLVEKIKTQYSGKRIIFSLGRLTYYKGYEYLINAAKYLNDEYIILIGGTGDLDRELRGMIDKENLEGRVVLLGKIPEADMSAYFKACDIFCMSSIERSEAFGVVLIEAMSFMKPIVATNILGSGVGWVNAHGDSGLNVPVRDPLALARAIEEVCSSGIYDQLSHGSYERFINLFQKSMMIDRFKDLFCQC